MSLFGNEEVYMTLSFNDSYNIAFHKGYMYIIRYSNNGTIYRVNLSNMAINVLIVIPNVVPSAIKVYGNTLYIACYETCKVMSIDLTATVLQANIVLDYSADINSNYYNFYSFIIDNGYLYLTSYNYPRIFCYNLSTGNRTILNNTYYGSNIVGIGVYNKYLYIARNPSIIYRISMSNANTNISLNPGNTQLVYNYGSNTISSFEIYFNNAVICMFTNGVLQLIHMDLDNSDITYKTISQRTGGVRPIVYNKYIYIPSGVNRNTITRVPIDLNYFKDDSFIFPNNGLGWKFEINCSKPFIKIDYVPII